MTDHMTPVDAALLAGSIEEAMSALSTFDLHPVTNAADIETMRARAEALTRDLLGYLLASPNFVPVIEAPDAVQEWEVRA